MPMIADSEIGVSITRISPNSSYKPCVTPNAPPYGPTSSPSTNTFGSRRISSASASRIASRYETSRIHVGDGFFGARVRRIRREVHRIVNRRLHPRFDFLFLLVVKNVESLQIGRESRNWIAALPHRELLVRTIERLVVFGVPVPAVRLALNQRRTLPAAGPRQRAQRRLIDREHVVAVDSDAIEPISRRAIGHIVDRHALFLRHRVRVLVVFADEKDRQVLDSCEVQGLVEVT